MNGSLPRASHHGARISGVSRLQLHQVVACESLDATDDILAPLFRDSNNSLPESSSSRKVISRAHNKKRLNSSKLVRVEATRARG